MRYFDYIMADVYMKLATTPNTTSPYGISAPRLTSSHTKKSFI